jgi:uncharacterized protein (TIGR03067 family)
VRWKEVVCLWRVLGAAVPVKAVVAEVGTSIEIQGETTPVPDDESFFTFSKGGKVKMIRLRAVGESERREEGTFKINATKTPKEIDLIVPKEGGKQEIMKAIYQLDGDTLKMAYTPARGMEGDRPTSFDSKQAFITTLKRR